MDRETGNQGTTTQSPTRFSTAPLISTITWIHNPLSYCQTPGSMAGRRSCFAKQRRAAVAFHTIVRRRTRCIPTSDQALCPVGIPRRKAASKADSAPPMSHPMQQKGHPGGSKTSNARNKTQENDIMCRTDSSFLDLLGLGLLQYHAGQSISQKKAVHKAVVEMGYVGPPVLRKKTPCRSVTSSKALLGLCCLVLGQSCHVMRLPLTA